MKAGPNGGPMAFVDAKLQADIRAFNDRGQVGPDPLAARYAERRAGYSLFARQIAEQDIEALRPYLFCYGRHGIPRKPGDPKTTVRNYIAGEWRPPASGEHAEMACPADRRVVLFDVPASGKQDVEAALAYGDQTWKSLAWADEGLAYRKQVVKNVSRILNYFTEEYLHEIRQQIPKTQLEAEKDFFEAKRACDHLVAVVAVTGSSDTARAVSAGRGLQRTRFEGGGCNWAWVDDGYSEDELQKIAARLTYAKLGLSSHKCTGLHGIAASRSTLDRLVPLLAAEMDRWTVADPRRPDAADRTLGPLMVHKAQTALDLVSAARKAGLKIVREGGRAPGEYGQHAEAVKPALIDGVTPQTKLEHDWDDKGVREYELATTELFMPVLVTMAMPDFEAFVRFSLFDNPHDLATSIWTRDDRKLTRARRTLAGMIKENDGTDSALEWEEFGASTVGESGNMGVGEVRATLSIYARRQKGRHFVF